MLFACRDIGQIAQFGPREGVSQTVICGCERLMRSTSLSSQSDGVTYGRGVPELCYVGSECGPVGKG